MQIEPSSYNRDRVFKKSKNHFVVFQFQHSRLTRDDLARFALYTYSLSRKYDAYVSLYVVCGPEIRNPISSYELDENNSFNMNIVSLNNYDGDEILDSISNKVIHSEKLNENDLSDLMFLPLMSSKNSIYIQLKKCIELANTIENVDKRKLNMIFHIKSKIFQK